MIKNPQPRGRPPKSNAMTPAERARRYRAKKKVERLNGEEGRADTIGQANARLIALQMKYDLERQLNVELRSALATRPQQALPNQPKSTREILAMKKTIHELERIVSAYSAEINRLRDELAASRKLPRSL